MNTITIIAALIGIAVTFIGGTFFVYQTYVGLRIREIETQIINIEADYDRSEYIVLSITKPTRDAHKNIHFGLKKLAPIHCDIDEKIISTSHYEKKISSKYSSVSTL
ncbi:hypothetical protein [Ferruginibacter sp. HRS2-29]|uniref:hypothetical protein n=1 Tax=Ferruginibacter sp. HRS2-29 TaxID=2487334 RepID=UPI0020CC2259|nr:hypothetical protein [Ferruginibacter sp. HRS2-29]MCP9752840.1 hypothetical protein [Ferruginibacter sp. HRS2-29]